MGGSPHALSYTKTHPQICYTLEMHIRNVVSEILEACESADYFKGLIKS